MPNISQDVESQRTNLVARTPRSTMGTLVVHLLTEMAESSASRAWAS
jgi:hypothetical protein